MRVPPIVSESVLQSALFPIVLDGFSAICFAEKCRRVIGRREF
jgi:hypothetical protein